MDKSELIHRVAAHGYYIESVKELLDIIFNEIAKEMVNGGRYFHRGFGTFGAKLRKGHPMKHVSTGEISMVADHMVPFFKAGVSLKASVKAGELLGVLKDPKAEECDIDGEE